MSPDYVRSAVLTTCPVGGHACVARAASLPARKSYDAHATLDCAVWSAYGWDDPDPEATTDEEILERLLALSGERAATATQR